MSQRRDQGGIIRRVAVIALFWVYAVAWFLTARAIGHHWLAGWQAKLATMALMALGMLPWSTWLAPRIVWALGIFGRTILLACYAVVLPLFALITRASGDLLRRRRPVGGNWSARRAIPNTLDAARMEA